MEGPSLFLAAEQLSPFIGKTILAVEGNTRIGKERLQNQSVLNIFSWGKHLVFQFEDFALRVHFMLFGSFEAIVKGEKVTGDYPARNRAARLSLSFENGEILFFSCSLKYLETSDAHALYDTSIDIMSSHWNEKKALEQLQSQPEEEIGDVLLDQTVFAGVGNIIKNEVLFLVKRKPTTLLSELSIPQRQKIVKTTRKYVFQFYKWRKRFVLRKHYQIYRKSVCPICQGKVTRMKTGKRERLSYFCLNCQK